MSRIRSSFATLTLAAAAWAATSPAQALNPQPLPPRFTTPASVLAWRALNPQPLPPRRILMKRVGAPIQPLDSVVAGSRVRF